MNIDTTATASARVALSVLTRGAATGNAVQVAAQTRPASPAYTIDPRIAELVNALPDARAAERDALQTGTDAGAATARRAGMDARRQMVEGAERSVVQNRQSLEMAKKIVSLYEETGQLYQPAQGKLAEYTPKEGWKPGELEEIIEGTKKAIVYKTQSLPNSIANAERMRAEYNDIIRGISSS